MTTHDDLDPRDELASTHLDGLTSPEEGAAIAADPDLQARVAAMAAVRAALRAPVPVDPAARDQAIAAALRAADRYQSGVATVTDLTVAAARRRLPGRARRLVGVAAVIALLALAVGVVAQVGDDADEDLAATADDEAAETAGDDGAEEQSALDGAAPEAGTTAGGSRSAGAGGDTGESFRTASLGEFADVAALATAVGDRLSDQDESAPPPATSAAIEDDSSEQRCADRAAGVGEAGAAILLVGVAVLDGRDVVVTVVQRSDGRRMLTAADAGTCEEIATTELVS